MNVQSFTGPGSTPSRRRFWDQVSAAVSGSTKQAGRNVTVSEHQGKGTVINVADTSTRRGGGGGVATGACCIGEDCSITTEAACTDAGGTYQGDGTTCSPNPCVTPDCSSCDDLQPTNPSGVPVHINIVRTLSGSCGTGTLAGSQTYDLDLGFALVGPIGGHIFCAHNIFDNGFGAFWTGAFTCNGAPFYSQGFGGLLGRDNITCEWWLELDTFSTAPFCGGCTLGFATIFQMIASPGDPSGVYVFTETISGVTLTTTVTIT